MNFESFSKIATRFVIQACSTYDLAESAYKMMMWENVGSEKEAWKEAPYITSPANKPDINRNFPYILAMSDYQKIVAPFECGENPTPRENGGVPMGINFKERAHEHLLSSQTIITLFAILEDYEFQLFEKSLEKNIQLFDKTNYKLEEIQEKGIENIKSSAIKEHSARYQRTPVTKRLKEILPKLEITLNSECIKNYQEISDRRAELAHEVDPDPASMKEVVFIFVETLDIGKIIGSAFNDETAINYKFPSHILSKQESSKS
ncbi:hypothetical protein GCM10009112_09010 [Marinomonas arenicola]|uniref:hypothetical protein n=1 Tax=Marinomonas TaxID=28253 RepID=UPI001056C496|nr:hypothetical protein [Marinomonas sp. KMM3893]